MNLTDLRKLCEEATTGTWEHHNEEFRKAFPKLIAVAEAASYHHCAVKMDPTLPIGHCGICEALAALEAE